MPGTSSGNGGSGNIPPRPGGKRPVPKRPTGKPPSNFSSRPVRPAQRTSARQAVQARRQRNIYAAMGSVALVVVVIVVFVVVKLASSGGSTSAIGKKGYPSGTFGLSAALVRQVTDVPLSAIVKNGETGLKADEADPSAPPVNAPYKIKGSPLTKDGKPEMLFMGAEFCPYCAGERWAMVMALSQFGTFTGLRGTTSSKTDENPSTPTFSFYNSSYTSKYISFVPVEEETNADQPLQSPTNAEQKVVEKWDVYPYVPQGENGYPIPFIYIDGHYLVTGIQYNAGQIANEQFELADSYITSGANSTSQNAEGSAAFLVGDICTLTNDQPANVCSKVPANLKGVNAASESKGSSSVTTTTAGNKSSTTTTTTKKSAG